jgi:ribosomal protein L40E
MGLADFVRGTVMEIGRWKRQRRVAASETEIHVLHTCGASNPPKASFCRQCGERLFELIELVDADE